MLCFCTPAVRDWLAISDERRPKKVCFSPIHTMWSFASVMHPLPITKFWDGMNDWLELEESWSLLFLAQVNTDWFHWAWAKRNRASWLQLLTSILCCHKRYVTLTKCFVGCMGVWHPLTATALLRAILAWLLPSIYFLLCVIVTFPLSHWAA